MLAAWYELAHKLTVTPDPIKLNIGTLGVLFQRSSGLGFDARINAWNARHFRCRECKKRLHTLLYLGTSTGPVIKDLPPNPFYQELQKLAQDIFDQCAIIRIVPVMCDVLCRSLPSPEELTKKYVHWEVAIVGNQTSASVQSDRLFRRSLEQIIDIYITKGEFTRCATKARILGVPLLKTLENILPADHPYLAAVRRLIILVQTPSLGGLAELEFLVNSPYGKGPDKAVVCYYAETSKRVIEVIENARDEHALRVLLKINKTSK